MKRAIMFVAQGVQDEEYIYPYYRLKEAGFKLDVVLSPSKIPNDKTTGKYGIPIQWTDLTCNLYPGFGFSQPDLDYDICIIPGGWQAPEIMRMDPYILKFLKYHNGKNRIIGAICHGPQVLISAEIVYERAITGYQGIKDDIINAGAYYHEQSCIRHKNLITAQHYKDNPKFMKEILNFYYEREREEDYIKNSIHPRECTPHTICQYETDKRKYPILEVMSTEGL